MALKVAPKGKKADNKAPAKKGVLKPFIGEFTPPGKNRSVKMFYLKEKEDDKWPAVGLSLSKCRKLVETPGAIAALKQFVLDNTGEGDE